MKLKREIRQLLETLHIPLNTVALTHGGHVKIQVRGNIIFTSSTPSDHRGLKNLKAHLNRAKKSPKKSATSSLMR